MSNTTQAEPVMNSSYLAGALSTFVKLVLVMLVSLKVIDLSDGDQVAITTALTAGIDLAIVIATMYFGARSKVTPTANPRIVNEHGVTVDLIRADTGERP